MAAKRPRGDSDENSDRLGDKRIKRRPSFATVIKEAMMVSKQQSMLSSLEPLFRKVVQEEVERILLHGTYLRPQRSLQQQVEPAEPSSFKLIFQKPLSQPIFTGTKIDGFDNTPLQILLVATNTLEAPPSLIHLHPLRVELVALQGDFPAGDQEDWTSDEFNSQIVKERTGKRPLLIGDVTVMLRDGAAFVSELYFTDNSSWGKSGMFKIGARVVPGSYRGPRIREAMTEPFKVKDHRGESYKKHYPPALEDEVWRLEKIAKDGKFHKKLADAKINTVQDFLKLWFVNPQSLRQILGQGMSDRKWEATINHAKTCVVGDKLYIHHGRRYALVLNSVCQVVNIIAGANRYTLQDLVNRADRDHVHQLAREAYENWGHLEEFHGLLPNTNLPLHQINVQMPRGTVEPDLYTDQEEVGTFVCDFGDDGVGPFNFSDVQSTTY
ncbi:unnamed protein product [Musa acuminata subsp. burmannicoides]